MTYYEEVARETVLDLLILIFLYAAHGLSYLEISVFAKMKGISSLEQKEMHLIFSIKKAINST